MSAIKYQMRPEPDELGQRLDFVIAAKYPGISRNMVQRLIEQGNVTLNGQVLKKNHKVLDETYSIVLPEPESAEPAPEDIPLNVVFEDDDLIVIDKPKGMVVHPAPGHGSGTLVNALIAHCGESLSGIGGVLRPGIVHRLDKDTSGLLIAAKNDFTHAKLGEQLSRRTLKRVYETLVRGRVKNESGRINAPIGRSLKDRKKMAVTEKGSKPAITGYELIRQYDNFAHLRCRLETGRTHQIRVHLAYIGHPVAGDTVYGAKKTDFGLEGQCLHAREISFIHPRSEKKIDLQSPLPDYFTIVLGKLASCSYETL